MVYIPLQTESQAASKKKATISEKATIASTIAHEDYTFQGGMHYSSGG
jgi:hypothetical protein